MKVAVVGTGYVGLVTAVCLAEHGHSVICVDVDEPKVQAINAGHAPFFERGLEELLTRHAGAGLTATTDLPAAVNASDVSIIAVGTPFDGHQVDLSQIKAASGRIGLALRHQRTYHVVIVKSTVVPGTTDDVVRPILEEASGRTIGSEIGVAMNPEFLREGEAIDDFMNPDRIVIGGIDERSIDTVAALYECFAGVPLVRTNTRTAEMIKYGTNALWATLISFANEVGNLCASVGDVDVVDVMKGVHLDRRLSPIVNDVRVSPGALSYLAAGCGFGGSCLPKDVKALVAQGRSLDLPMRLLDAVIEVNREQPMQIIAALERHFGDLAGVRVTALGLAFKPGTDDLRESPAIRVIDALAARSAHVTVYDPIVGEAGASTFAAERASSLADAVEQAQAIVILTSWEEFKQLPHLVNALAHPPVVIDGRRMIDRRSVARYSGIGFRHTPASATALTT